MYFAESKWGYIIPPRSFIWNIGKKFFQINNIVNSIVPKEFYEFIENALDKRGENAYDETSKTSCKARVCNTF